MPDPDFQFAALSGEVLERQPFPARVGNIAVLLCRFEGKVFALENCCSHADQPLAGGVVRNGWIACPFHGSRFDLATGEPLNPPATCPVRTFAAREADGAIEVALGAC